MRKLSKAKEREGIKHFPLKNMQKFSLVAQMVKNLPTMQETWVGKIPWRKEWLPTPGFLPGEFYAWSLAFLPGKSPGQRNPVYGVAKTWARLSD